MRRRLRWFRRRALRAVRSHYMFAVSIVVFAIAAAAGLGYFDPDVAEEDTPSQAPPSVERPPAAPANTSVEGLTVTYLLVASEAERAAWDSVETAMNHRGFLTRYAVEVLVVTNEAQTMDALMLVDDLRSRYPWNQYVVEDLREP